MQYINTRVFPVDQRSLLLTLPGLRMLENARNFQKFFSWRWSQIFSTSVSIDSLSVDNYILKPQQAHPFKETLQLIDMRITSCPLLEDSYQLDTVAIRLRVLLLWCFSVSV